jgi:uncharacterized membrane protein YeiH
MDPLALVLTADRIGIIAFAISGVAVGVRAKLDLYGLAALGLSTAIGGGVIRDVVIGDIPRVFVNTDYLLFAFGATGAAVASVGLRWTTPGPVLKVADSIGTAAFAPTGALLAYDAGLDWPAAMILAVLTATGGGVIRDVLARELPWVLHRGLNASASIAGGLVTFFLMSSPTAALLVGGAVTLVITLLGHTERVRLPVFHRET